MATLAAQRQPMAQVEALRDERAVQLAGGPSKLVDLKAEQRDLEQDGGLVAGAIRRLEGQDARGPAGSCPGRRPPS